MVKVKIFGVIRSTTGFGYIEVQAKNVQDIFDEISSRMEKGYYEDLKKEEEKKKSEISDIEVISAEKISDSIEDSIKKTNKKDKNNEN